MAAVDNFQDSFIDLHSPLSNLYNVTPSDSTDLPLASRAIHVTGSAGTVAVTTIGMQSGTSVSLYLGQGALFPARVTRVWNTGTTATGIVAGL